MAHVTVFPSFLHITGPSDAKAKGRRITDRKHFKRQVFTVQEGLLKIKDIEDELY